MGYSLVFLLQYLRSASKHIHPHMPCSYGTCCLIPAGHPTALKNIDISYPLLSQPDALFRYLRIPGVLYYFALQEPGSQRRHTLPECRPSRSGTYSTGLQDYAIQSYLPVRSDGPDCLKLFYFTKAGHSITSSGFINSKPNAS